MFLASYVLLWILNVLMLAALYLLYRHFGKQMLDKKEQVDSQGPSVNQKIEVVLETIDGRSVEVGAGGRPYLIAFTSAGCLACKQIQPLLGDAVERAKDGGRDLVVVHQGDVESTRAYTKSFPARVFAVSDPKKELSRLWRVKMTPFLIATDASGIVRSKSIGGSQRHIDSLVLG